jgi:hypothetical protein
MKTVLYILGCLLQSMALLFAFAGGLALRWDEPTGALMGLGLSVIGSGVAMTLAQIYGEHKQAEETSGTSLQSRRPAG